MLEELRFTKERVEEGLRNALPSETHLLLLGAFAVAMAVLGVFYFLNSAPKEIKYVSKPSVSSGSRAKAAVPPRRKVKIAVHVAGRVKHPQVYYLADGARAIEAIEAAGGSLPEADLDALNLAAKLADGERLYVPAQGEVPVAADAAGQPSDGKVDLNKASATDLEQLDGIGPKLAERIVKYRVKIRAFKDIGQLEEVDGIGPKKLEMIKDQVVIR